MEDLAVQIRSVKSEAARLCAGLEALSPARRLTAAAELRRVMEDVTGKALDASMIGARNEGWGLRRIGNAVGLSHETVRGRLVQFDAADRSRP